MQTPPPLFKHHMIFEHSLTANFAGYMEMCNITANLVNLQVREAENIGDRP